MTWETRSRDSPRLAFTVASWQEFLPARLGDLPLGGDLVRTDPGGAPGARIAILGVYPALTRKARFDVGDDTLHVPVAVERTSFDPASSSGKEIDSAYLRPLGLVRSEVFLFDMMPFYLANTSRARPRMRSMWDNVQAYENASGHKTAVRPRPEPDRLVEEARRMPGNLDRLSEQLTTCHPDVILTLGNEAASLIRGNRVAADAQQYLLQEAAMHDVLGSRVLVVHLPHPGIVMKHSGWRERLATWCRDRGQPWLRDVRGG